MEGFFLGSHDTKGRVRLDVVICHGGLDGEGFLGGDEGNDEDEDEDEFIH